MSSPNEFPDQNPNPHFNPDQMSYTNLMMFGTPNIPGAASSQPTRHPNPPQYAMYPPPPPYYQPQPYDYSQQQQPYYHPQQPYFQQQPYPPPQQAQQPELQPEQPTQRAGKQTQESPRKRSHKKRSEPGPKACPKKNWAGAEEAWLATCWCDTSEDPITGNNQKRGTLWTTIEENFNCNDHGWVRYADALSSK